MDQDDLIKCVIAGIVCLTITAVVVYFVIRSLERKTNRTVKGECEKFVNFACQHPIEKIFPKKLSIDIKGGQNSTLGQVPHMAYVKVDSNRASSVCGGSLISEYFVLSAAHCLFNFIKEDFTIKVKLGSLTSDLFDGTGEVFDVEEYFIHDGFIGYNHKINDMLLLKLDEEVQFSSTIRPICLNTEYSPEKYKNITTSGWGRTKSGKLSKYLQITQLFINEGSIKSKCNLSKFGNFNETEIICAGYPGKWNSPQAGDSGGPLQIPLDNKCGNNYVYEQIGVTSSVQNGAVTSDHTVLSLFTKVHQHIPWIKNIVWP